MACYFVTLKGDNKVVDIGNSMRYSTHGSLKIAHVYHPIINCHVPSFCYWDVSEYDVYYDDNLYYWDVLRKNKIHGDIDGNDMGYYNGIKKANLKYSRNVGLYL